MSKNNKFYAQSQILKIMSPNRTLYSSKYIYIFDKK